MAAIKSLDDERRLHTKEEMHEALSRFLKTIRHEEGTRAIFSIPPQDYDADIVLSDTIRELLALRELVAPLPYLIEQVVSMAEGALECTDGGYELGEQLEKIGVRLT